MSELGDKLLSLCAQADGTLLLVAPFIKVRALAKLLSHAHSSVEVQCITRWHPYEIATGVSDLEVWTTLQDRGNASLLLQPSLHAKYFRSGTNCLVGSANITGAALGWSRTPNIELLVATEPLMDFEADLVQGCTRVSEDLYQDMKKLVSGIGATTAAPPAADDVAPSPTREAWLPRLRTPESLYRWYVGDRDSMTRASQMAASEDLAVLDVPAGLPRNAFEACVAAQLLQMPSVNAISDFIDSPKRFGEMRDRVRSVARSRGTQVDPSLAWQTLMRWLLHFLPYKFAVMQPRHSEVIVRLSHEHVPTKDGSQD